MDFEEKQWAEAESTIAGLIRSDPANATWLAFYGRLMLFTGHVDKATELVGEALRRDPHNHEARIVAAIIATIRGDRVTAQEELAELIRDDPEGEHVVHALFFVLIEERRYREALPIGQQLLRLNPNDEALVEAVIALRAQTHWIALPAYPLQRWGWLAAALMWGGFAVIISISRRTGESPAIVVFAVIYLVYVIYSWTYGPLLRQWITWRGV